MVWTSSLSRRAALLGLASTGLAGPAVRASTLLEGLGKTARFGPATAFDFHTVIARARQLASEPFRPVSVPYGATLDQLDYDQHWQIRFRKDAALPLGRHPMEFFHLGKYAREPVRMAVLEGGEAREVRYAADLFDMPIESPARALPETAGFAGFRLMRPGGKPDWISFLGASYFRCDGPEAQYGLSARGLALNTGLSTPEEFPRFTEFTVGAGERPGEDAVIYAVLDGPSVTGAYRISATREGDGPQRMHLTKHLFFRSGVERLGVAPLTSMYWYSETNRRMGDDWRPEIHDSDGLALHTGAGERIWRPLRNPAGVVTTSYFDNGPRGFGLSQRDRAFGHYQDDGVFYNRRPSAWITPDGDWGEGAVQLIEIPAHDETFDNIVAYWMPARLPVAGDTMVFSYGLDWVEADPAAGDIARAVATWRGAGGVPGQPLPPGLTKLVVDFDGPSLDGITDGVEIAVEANGGEILRPSARPIVSGSGWRAKFDLTGVGQGEGAVEVRVFLHRAGEPLTETWTMPVTA